jgi:glutathione S-transferase
LYGEAPAAINAAIAGFNKQVMAAEQALNNTNYLLGESFTAADLMLTTVLTWAESYGIELSARLSEYANIQVARPAFKSAAKLNFSISAGA